MTINYFIHILLKRWKWLVVVPLLAAIAVYFLTSKKPREYSSKMSVYTGLTSGVSIESESSKVDNNQASLAYDNLINVMKSDKTLEEVGLKLFANVLVHQDKNGEFITATSFEKLTDLIPDEVKRLVVPNSFKGTLEGLRKYMHKDDENFLYSLINQSATNFSKGALSRVEARRVKSSDIMEITYTADDPAICYQTLKLIYEETIQNYKSMKMAQSNDVVRYFEAQLDSSARKLNNQEDEFVKYSQENKIINFQEQTKHVVAQKLDMDMRFDQLTMQKDGASKILSDMEAKMNQQSKLRLKSAEILILRSQISRLAAENALETSLSNDSIQISNSNKIYDKRLAKLKKDFVTVLDNLSSMKHTANGLSIDQILARWLESVVDLEEAKAQLPILEKRAKVLDELYNVYAPMGATVKRKERAIDVTERQYLSLLGSLSAAKMREKNDIISANAIRVLDEPYYPFSALPDKSRMMAIVTAFAVLLLILAVIVITEFYDKTLLNPIRAERLLGARVKLLYPLLINTSKIKRAELRIKAGEALAIEVLRHIHDSLPVNINLISLYPQEGKSMLIDLLSDQFKKISVLFNEPCLADINFTEIPALKISFVNKDQVKAAGLNILVCRSNRAWKSIDSRMLNDFISLTGTIPIILLNGVPIDVFESFMGELPLQRGRARRYIKKLMNFEFNSADSL